MATFDQDRLTRPGMRIPPSEDFPTGPGVGDRLPDFTLPDQHGKAKNFGRERAGKQALVVFHRSARW